MIVRGFLLAALVLTGASLGGCIPEQIKSADGRPTASLPASIGDSEPVGVQRIIANIPRGTRIGSYYVSPVCVGARDSTWTNDYGAAAPREIYGRLFGTLSRAGLRVAGDPTRLFEASADRLSARYLVGAKLTEIQVSLCDAGGFTAERGVSGDAYIKVEWEVFSVAERRIVYDRVTDGNAKNSKPRPEGGLLLIYDAFEAAAARLAADPGFRSLVSRTATTPIVAAAPSGDEPLEIPRFANFRDSIAPRVSDLRESVVSIIVANAHGSGFFLTSDGLILTNRHVVGDATSVTVRLLAGVEVPGRVLRRDATRDVALVKVDLARTRPLPVRVEPARVGEEVYALGSPVNLGYSGSVTRGVVSGLRRQDRGGADLAFIQSDVAIQGGNSGGPLVDGAGNLIGVAVAGLGPDGLNRGLNLFIPVADALDRLNLRLGATRELRF